MHAAGGRGSPPPPSGWPDRERNAPDQTWTTLLAPFAPRQYNQIPGPGRGGTRPAGEEGTVKWRRLQKGADQVGVAGGEALWRSGWAWMRRDAARSSAPWWWPGSGCRPTRRRFWPSWGPGTPRPSPG